MPRARSAPRTKRAREPESSPPPDPWRTLHHVGGLDRTASALAELALETRHMPETWQRQSDIADMVLHDVLSITEKYRKSLSDSSNLIKFLYDELDRVRRDADNWRSAYLEADTLPCNVSDILTEEAL